MNLLLIDRTIPFYNDFVNSLNDNTKYISYDCVDTVKTITNKISKLNTSNFNNLVFVFVESGVSKMIGNSNYRSDEMKTFIHDTVLKYNVKIIDFLACNLLNYDVWKKYFEFLQSDNNVVVRGSNDRTGNLKYGGNWILESTNQDIKNLYFNSNIDNWKGVLDLPSSSFIIKNGTLYGCGYNAFGNLGIGGGNVNILTLIDKFSGNDVIGVGSSSDNSLAFTSESVNNLYVTGKNNSGQLGTGNVLQVSEFIKTTGFSDKTVIGVACGDGHCLVITSEEKNNLYVAGDNSVGQLGLGNSIVAEHTFVNADLTDKTIIGVYCAGNSSIILTSTGEIWGCGANNDGELGMSYTSSSITIFTKIPFNKKVVGVSLSFGYSCVITDENSLNLYTAGYIPWKSGAYNALTDHGYYQMTEITQKVIQVSCGTSHAGIILDGGLLYTTGINNHGELGWSPGTPEIFTQYFDIIMIGTPKFIECFNNYSLALANTQLCVAGSDSYGQLNMPSSSTDVTRFFANELNVTNIGNAFPVRSLNVSCDGNIGSTTTQDFVTTFATGTINTSGYTFSIVSNPSIGSVTVSGSQFIYTAPSQLSKVKKVVDKLKALPSITFTYTVIDPIYNIVSNVGTVTINFSSTPPTPPPSSGGRSITLWNREKPKLIDLKIFFPKLKNNDTAFISSSDTSGISTMTQRSSGKYELLSSTKTRLDLLRIPTQKYNNESEHSFFYLQYTSKSTEDLKGTITLSVRQFKKDTYSDVVVPVELKCFGNNIITTDDHLVKPSFNSYLGMTTINISSHLGVISQRYDEQIIKSSEKPRIGDPTDNPNDSNNIKTMSVSTFSVQLSFGSDEVTNIDLRQGLGGKINNKSFVYFVDKNAFDENDFLISFDEKNGKLKIVNKKPIPKSSRYIVSYGIRNNTYFTRMVSFFILGSL